MLEGAIGATHLGQGLPSFLQGPRVLGNAPWQWGAVLLGVVAAWILGHLVAKAAIWLLLHAARRTSTRRDEELVEAARRPLRLAVAVFLFREVVAVAGLTSPVEAHFLRAAYTVLVLAIAWFALRGLRSGTDWIESRLGEGAEDVRGLHTQLTVLRRIVAGLVVAVAGAIALMQFDFVRSLGVSLLASAGLVSLVVGVAAQKTLGAVIAGVQLSIAQPLRIGDAVTIEAESGEVEEIHLTYVVVRCWDHRRLIVPVARLLEQPFVNWTKLGTALFGVVTLHVPWATPVDAVREELARVCKESSFWDGRKANLVVLDTLPDALVLSALVSAKNVDQLFALRCEVREKLVHFVRTRQGGAFGGAPKRAESAPQG